MGLGFLFLFDFFLLMLNNLYIKNKFYKLAYANQKISLFIFIKKILYTNDKINYQRK